MKNMSLFLQRLVVMLSMAVCLNVSAADRYFSERDQQVVTKVIAEYDAAVLKADADALEKTLAGDYSFIDANGNVWNKGQEIASYRTGDLKIESKSRVGTSMRLYVGAALVTGTLEIKGKYKGEDISGSYRYTEIYEPRTGGIWQLEYAQVTKVPEKVEKTEKK